MKYLEFTADLHFEALSNDTDLMESVLGRLPKALQIKPAELIQFCHLEDYYVRDWLRFTGGDFNHGYDEHGACNCRLMKVLFMDEAVKRGYALSAVIQPGAVSNSGADRMYWTRK